MMRFFVAILAVLLAARFASGQANIRLNEIHLNPPNPDGNFEFIELKSTSNGVEPCTGLSIIIINNDRIDADTGLAENLGEISEVFSLNDLSTGTNGLLLLGNGYTATPRGGPWSGFVDAATVVADPAGMGDSDIGSNDGLSILLVSGLTALKDQDVDVDDDTLLDWADPTPPANRQFAAPPWTAIIDSIGTRDRGTDAGAIATNPYTAAAANISQTWIASSMGNRDPDTMARQLGSNGPSLAQSWYGGKLAGTTSATVTYQATRIFGPGNPAMLGEVTPGRPNLAATLSPTSFRISEIGLNPSGDNDRFQYIEIINTGTATNPAPAARNLDGFWLILMDSYDGGGGGNDDSPGGGQILEKWDLSSMATGTNGLLLIGNDFSSAYNPFNDLPSSQTGFGDPEQQNGPPPSTGFGEGDIRFKNGMTLLLIQGFVDSSADFDTNDDGIADLPLTNLGTIVDQVGFSQVGRTGLGRTYAAVDLRGVMPAQMVPDNLSRRPGDVSVTATAWYGGEHEDGSPGFNVAINRRPVTPPGGGTAYNPWFGGFRGGGTPGLPNLSAAIDPSAPPVPAVVRISEVMFNPTNNESSGNDDAGEYIELSNPGSGVAYLDGLWLVVVDLDSVRGTIIRSAPLDGRMTGLNGITLIGERYNEPDFYPYRTSDGPLPPACAAFDTVWSSGGNDLPNNGLAVMLLRAPLTGPGNALTLSADGLILSGDLDPDDDGVLLTPSAVASEVVDSIAVSAVNPGPGYGWVNTAGFSPHHVARYPSNTASNSGAAFLSGQVTQSSAQPSVEYTNVWSGTFKGAGSPGRPNHAAATGPVDPGSVVINEVHLNPPGGDGNFEFVEIADTQSRNRSLNGYYLLMLDNVAPNTGAVRHSWSLDGMSTGDNGLLLLGNRYPVSADNPWSAVASLRSRTGDPPGREGLDSSFSDGVLGEETDNLSATFLLVRGFEGWIGFDIDTANAAGEDSPGDGIIDDTPWPGGAAGIHDSIMLRDTIATTPPPSQPPTNYPWDGFSYGLADLSTAFLSAPNPYYHPESFARFYGEMTPNSTAAWYGGDLEGGQDGNDGSSVNYVTGDPSHPPFPSGFTGRATPGQPNLLRNPTGDPDSDGVPTFMEIAVATAPGIASPADVAAIQPVRGTVSVGGIEYATISYRRLMGGTAFKDDSFVVDTFTYTVETSTDLRTWISDGSTIEPVGQAQPNSDGLTETATYRLVAPLTSPAGRAFMRVRIGLP